MKTNSEYGGAQQETHRTNTKHNFGYPGPHKKIIEVGDDQNMI